MVIRYWRGSTESHSAAGYLKHLDSVVFPELLEIDGFQGSQVLRREHDGGFEFVVLTFWQSKEAIERFAGENVETAVVPPAAQNLLREYDSQVVHYDLALEYLVE